MIVRLKFWLLRDQVIPESYEDFEASSIWSITRIPYTSHTGRFPWQTGSLRCLASILQMLMPVPYRVEVSQNIKRSKRAEFTSNVEREFEKRKENRHLHGEDSPYDGEGAEGNKFMNFENLFMSSI